MTREEAINKIRMMKLSPGKDAELIIALHTLIPELAESEDERIRKKLIEYFSHCKEDREWWEGITPRDIIAYLEKQKDAFENGRQFGIMQEQARQEFEWPDEKQKESKQEWNDEDIEKNLIAYLRYERKSTPQEIEEKFIPYIKRIKTMEQEPISPMSYGSLDEAMQEAGRRFDLPCTDKDKYSVADVFYAGVRAERESKQEWSEEDESYLQTVISELEVSKKEAKKYEHKTYDAIISWLKSLRPSWKPSEHQMSILKAVKDYVGRGSGYWGEGLGSLIEDLEKLM